MAYLWHISVAPQTASDPDRPAAGSDVPPAAASSALLGSPSAKPTDCCKPTDCSGCNNDCGSCEPACCESSPWTLEDLWTFKSPRLVVYRDIKLAIAKWIMIIGVFLYFIIYEISMRENYLKPRPINGVVKVELASIDPGDASQHPYCCFTTSCFSRTFDATRGQQQCVSWDTARAGQLESDGVIHIVTRVSRTTFQPQQWDCHLNASSSTTCQAYQASAPVSYYVAGAETAVLKVSYGEIQMRGDSVGVNKQLRKAETSDSAVRVIALADILAAARVTLDQVPTPNAETNRYLGVDIAVLVDPAHGAELRVARLPRSSADVGVTKVWHRYESDTGRFEFDEWEMHGVRIAFSYVREEKYFNFAYFMRACAASGVLLYVCVFLIDWLFIPLSNSGKMFRKFRACRTTWIPESIDDSELGGITAQKYIYGENLEVAPPLPRDDDLEEQTIEFKYHKPRFQAKRAKGDSTKAIRRRVSTKPLNEGTKNEKGEAGTEYSARSANVEEDAAVEGNQDQQQGDMDEHSAGAPSPTAGTRVPAADPSEPLAPSTQAS